MQRSTRAASVILLIACAGAGLGCGTSGVGAIPRDGGGDSKPDVSDIAPCSDAGPAADCTDADIQASNYDQTCQTSSDCVLVGEGESCYPCSLAYGPFGAISRSAVSQYEADVAKTPGGSSMEGRSCGPGCGPTVIACCRVGRCYADSVCSEDAGDAGAE